MQSVCQVPTLGRGGEFAEAPAGASASSPTLALANLAPTGELPSLPPAATLGRQTAWTKEEDEQLRELVARHGTKKWALIASKISTKASKQCRRRWQNFLNVCIKKGGWSPEEDELLLEGHRRYGNRWTEIAKMVQGRTDNAVKNRYSALCKKGLGNSEDGSSGDATTGDHKHAGRAGLAHGGSSQATTPASQYPVPSTSGGYSSQETSPAKRPCVRPGLSIQIPHSNVVPAMPSHGMMSHPSSHAALSAAFRAQGVNAMLSPSDLQILQEMNAVQTPTHPYFQYATAAAMHYGNTHPFPPELLTHLQSPTGRGLILPSPGSADGTIDMQEVMNWLLSGTPTGSSAAAAAAAAKFGSGTAVGAPQPRPQQHPYGGYPDSYTDEASGADSAKEAGKLFLQRLLQFNGLPTPPSANPASTSASQQNRSQQEGSQST
eukprot:jgi/Chlat1/3952/Chrsp26S04210